MLPSAQRALANQGTNPLILQQLQQASPTTLGAIQLINAKRVANGQMPLSQSQYAGAVAAGNAGAPVTPHDSGGSLLSNLNPIKLIGSAVKDIGSIWSSLPHLPGAIVHDISQIPHIGEKFSEAYEEAGGGLKGIGAGLQQTPVVRFVPGTNTVGSVLQGQVSQLLEHPVMTALDVAPFAGAKVLKPAEGAALAAAKEAGGLGAALRSQVGELAPKRSLAEATGARIADTPIAPYAQNLSDAVKYSTPGHWMNQAFGAGSRKLAEKQNLAQSKLADQIDPESTKAYSPVSEAAREAGRIREERLANGIDDDRMAALSDAQETIGNIDALDPTDFERGIMERIKAQEGPLREDAIAKGLGGMRDGEYFDTGTLNKLTAAEREASRLSPLAEVRQLAEEGTTNPVELIAKLKDSEGVLNASDKRFAVEGLVHGLARAGYDIEPLQVAVEGFRKGASFGDTLDELTKPKLSIKADHLTPEEIITKLTPSKRVGKAASVIDSVRAGNYRTALKAAKTQGLAGVEGIDTVVSNLDRLNQHSDFLGGNYKKVVRDARVATKTYEKLVASNAPARFSPIIEKKAKEALIEKIDSPETMEAATTAILEGRWKDAGLTDKDFLDTVAEVTKRWQDIREELRAAGHEPVFQHHIQPGHLGLSTNLNAARIPTPAQAKLRSVNATPYIHDAAISMQAQALELLRKDGIENLIEDNAKSFGYSNSFEPGRRISDLEDRFAQQADRRGLTGNNRQLYIENQMRREGRIWNPAELFSFESPRLNAIKDSDVFLPYDVIKNIERFSKPLEKGPISTLTDPAMKAFRVSVLPLSPRWQLYNAFGGFITTSMEIGPVETLKLMRSARQMIKTGETEIGGTKVAYPETLRLTRGGQGKLEAQFEWEAGGTLGRLMNRIQESKIGKAGSGVVQKSYDLNGFFDDTYRAIGYLSGYDKALTKGLSETQRISMGEALMKKIMPNWNDITPLERAITRNVIPFYPFMQFIVRYSMRYPIDHPFRMAVMSNIVAAEMRDHGGHIPEAFQNMFVFGKPDAQGNRSALNLGGVNPFRGIGQMFTLAGFLSSTNPVIQTAAEQFGVDTQKGSPDLYPELDFDPETGQLVYRRPNVLSAALGNIIPQSQLFTNLAGASNNIRDLARTNPDAAQRMLISSAGLPVLFRTVNPTEIAIKSELNLERAQQTALSEALKSGTDSLAQYPLADQHLQQIRQLQQMGQLTQYQPQPGPSALDIAQQSLVTNLTGG